MLLLTRSDTAAPAEAAGIAEAACEEEIDRRAESPASLEDWLQNEAHIDTRSFDRALRLCHESEIFSLEDLRLFTSPELRKIFGLTPVFKRISKALGHGATAEAKRPAVGSPRHGGGADAGSPADAAIVESLLEQLKVEITERLSQGANTAVTSASSSADDVAQALAMYSFKGEVGDWTFPLCWPPVELLPGCVDVDREAVDLLVQRYGELPPQFPTAEIISADDVAPALDTVGSVKQGAADEADDVVPELQSSYGRAADIRQLTLGSCHVGASPPPQASRRRGDQPPRGLSLSQSPPRRWYPRKEGAARRMLRAGSAEPRGRRCARANHATDPRPVQTFSPSAMPSQPSAMPLRPLSPFLQEFEHEWLSSKHGHIVVRRLDRCGFAESTDLVVLSTSQSEPRALGTIYLVSEKETDKQQIFFRVDHESKPSLLQLAPKACRKSWVVWNCFCGETVETWDSALLDASRKAEKWIKEDPATIKSSTSPPEKHSRPATYLELALQLLPTLAQRPDPPRTVALCTTTKNRLWQLQHALPLNLLSCWPVRHWAKIHVVDFGSTDGTLDWIRKNCRAAMDCGLLAVYSTSKLPDWHASVGKNTVHSCASEEDILVNLDGDNVIRPGFVQDVAQWFSQGYTCLKYETKGYPGTCGCIACYREDFHKIGGYDEDGEPMGCQDTDLYQRLASVQGAAPLVVQEKTGVAWTQAIPNDVKWKTAFCGPMFSGVTWGEMDKKNRTRFNSRRRKERKEGTFGRNVGKKIGVDVQPIRL